MRKPDVSSAEQAHRFGTTQASQTMYTPENTGSVVSGDTTVSEESAFFDPARYGRGYHGAGVVPHMRISRDARNVLRKNMRNRPGGHARKGSANNLLFGEIQDVQYFPPRIPEHDLDFSQRLGRDSRTYTPRPENERMRIPEENLKRKNPFM